MVEELKRFLKEQAAYYKFEALILKLYNESIDSFYDSEFDDPQQYISRAFVWQHTDEGYDYWNDIDAKWRSHLRKLMAVELTLSIDEQLKLAQVIGLINASNVSNQNETTRAQLLQAVSILEEILYGKD